MRSKIRVLKTLAVAAVLQAANVFGVETVGFQWIWLGSSQVINCETDASALERYLGLQSPNVYLEVGESVTFTARPPDGYWVSWWAHGLFPLKDGDPAICDEGGNVVTSLVTHATSYSYTCTAENLFRYVGVRFDYFPYSVRLNKNCPGDTSSQTVSGTHLYPEQFALVANPFSRAGYAFAGWALTASSAATVADGALVDGKALGVKQSQTVDLYATWAANAYTVAFDGNGATAGSMANQAFTYDVAQALSKNAFVRQLTVEFNAGGGSVAPASQAANAAFLGWATSAGGTVAYSDGQSVQNLATSGTTTLYARWQDGSVTLPTPVKEESDFLGWYTAASGGTRVGGGGDIYRPTAAATTLYAQWQGGHHVTFSYYIGSKLTNDVRFVRHGGTVSPLPNADQRLGYAFKWWNGSYANVTEDGIVEAEYAVNSYTVRFDANGGEGYMSDEAFGYDTQKTLSKNLFTRAGYLFLGWSVDPAAAAPLFEDKESVCSLSPENGAVVMLYAVWQPIAYTLAFDGNGGEGAMDPLALTYGQAVTLPPVAFRNGSADFLHWSLGDATVADRATISNLTTSAGATVTLKAVWRQYYYIAYDAQGGEGEMPVQQVQRDAATALQPNGFNRLGCQYLGWATNAVDQAVVYTNGEAVLNLAAADVTNTLYAVWSNNTYTVEYQANGGEGEMSAQAFRCHEPQVLADVTFTRENCAFVGWTRDPANAVAAYTNAQEVTNLTFEADATVRLYALWTVPPPPDPEPLAVAVDCPSLVFTTNQIAQTLASRISILSNRTDAAEGGNDQYVRGWWTAGYQSHVLLSTELPQGTGTLQFHYRTTIAAEPGGFNIPGDLTLYVGANELWKTNVTVSEWATWTYRKTGEAPETVTWRLLGSMSATADDFADIDLVTWTSDAPALKTIAATFRLNDGTPAPDDIWANLTESSRVAFVSWPADPASAHGAFRGWYTAPTGGAKVESTDVAPSADVTYYAQWGSAAPVPTEADRVEASTVVAADGKLGIGFTANPDFAYNLLATDSLSPVSWYLYLGPTNGTGTLVFPVPLDPAVPQRFFRIETIQRLE